MTSIEWTGQSWNPVVGCSIKSAGCTNCYAMKVAHRGMSPQHRGLTVMTSRGAKWNGEVRFVPEMLSKPFTWKKPRRVFVNSMSDLFHEGLAFEQIAAVFGVMAACPQHTFQVLTKRPERAREFFAWIDAQPVSLGGPTVNAARGSRWHAWQYLADLRVYDPAQPWAWPLPNVHLGVSAENQETADERIPILLELPAAVRFVSAEPLLGPIDFDLPRCDTHDREFVSWHDEVGHHCGECAADGWSGEFSYGHWLDFTGDDGEAANGGITWVIVGGESGPGARPCDVAWIRSIVEQCASEGTACFVKQLGALPVRNLDTTGNFRTNPTTGKRQYEMTAERIELRDRKGGDITEWPEDLRVRQFPEVRHG